MQEYSITLNGKWITGNAQKGCYEWTNNKELRYTFEDLNKAITLAKNYIGAEVIGEHSHLIVSPETEELCGFCRCSLAYGYLKHKGILFCSPSCVDEVSE